MDTKWLGAAVVVLAFAGCGDPDADRLSKAAETGDTAATEALIESGVEVDAEDGGGETPLHKAARAGQVKTAALLMREGADANAKDDAGETPMHEAAKNDDEYLIGLLCNRGREDRGTWSLTTRADIGARDNAGRTPLHVAAGLGHAKVVSDLVWRLADEDARDRDGNGPLHFAARNGHTACVKALLPLAPDYETAKARGFYGMMSAITSGAPVNARNKDGDTPLHFAARNGHKATVAMLLGEAADVTAKNNAGKTPLDVATDPDVRSLLKQHRRPTKWGKLR